MPSPSDVEAYIRAEAVKRGIPADIAVGVARAESGLNVDNPGDWWVSFFGFPAGTPIIARTPAGIIVPRGTPGAKPTSFGPFQLRAGRAITGDPSEAGLGDSALAAGIDVTNPATWQQQVQYALDIAAGNGTFAGVWSTAVGALGQTFVAHPIGDITPPVGIDDPSKIIPPITVQQPGPLEGTLQGLVNAIAGLGTTIASPFVDTYNTALSWMTYFGQKNIYVRLLLILIGVLLLIAGVILFALSFVDKGTANKVSAAMAL